MSQQIILKKGEDKRLKSGHCWIYSNEIDTSKSSLKSFTAGEIVTVFTASNSFVGQGYINPHSLITVRLLTRNSDEIIDRNFFYNKILLAKELRDRLFPEPYYRLVYSEADLLPGLIIDRYGDHFAVQLNTAGMDAREKDIIEALKQAFPQLKSIMLRNESQVRELEGLALFSKCVYGEAPDKLIIEENGHKFFIPFTEGQKTGWFYDQRLNRARLKDYVAGCDVLDVFSYLGGFAIEAACFGAKKITSIESSKLACQFISENAKLNHVDNKLRIIQETANTALSKLISDKESFDVIIVDPPALIKKSKDRQSGMIAYQRFNQQAMRLLKPNGILISCSCSMHLSMDEFQHILQKAMTMSHSQLQILERGHQSPDHPIHLAIAESDYLKVVFMRKIQ